jgi:hypothetical protein
VATITVTAAKITKMRFNFKTDLYVRLLTVGHYCGRESFVSPVSKERVVQRFLDDQKERHNVFRRMDARTSFVECLRARRSRAPAQEEVYGPCEHGQGDRIIQVVQEPSHFLPVLPEVVAQVRQG